MISKKSQNNNVTTPTSKATEAPGARSSIMIIDDLSFTETTILLTDSSLTEQTTEQEDQISNWKRSQRKGREMREMISKNSQNNNLKTTTSKATGTPGASSSIMIMDDLSHTETTIVMTDSSLTDQTEREDQDNNNWKFSDDHGCGISTTTRTTWDLVAQDESSTNRRTSLRCCWDESTTATIVSPTGNSSSRSVSFSPTVEILGLITPSPPQPIDHQQQPLKTNSREEDVDNDCKSKQRSVRQQHKENLQKQMKQQDTKENSERTSTSSKQEDEPDDEGIQHLQPHDHEKIPVVPLVEENDFFGMGRRSSCESITISSGGSSEIKCSTGDNDCNDDTSPSQKAAVVTESSKANHGVLGLLLQKGEEEDLPSSCAIGLCNDDASLVLEEISSSCCARDNDDEEARFRRRRSRQLGTVVEKKQSYTEYLEQLQDYLQEFLLDRHPGTQSINSDEDYGDDLEYDHDDDDWRDIMKQLQEEQQKHDDPPLVVVVVVVSSDNREQQATTTTSITERKKRRRSLLKPLGCIKKVVVWPFKFESNKGARKSGKKK